MSRLIFRTDRPTQVGRVIAEIDGSLVYPIEDDVLVSDITLLPLDGSSPVQSYKTDTVYSDSDMLDFKSFRGSELSVSKRQWDEAHKESTLVEYRGTLHDVDDSRLVFDIGEKLELVPKTNIESIVIPKSSRSELSSFIKAVVGKHIAGNHSTHEQSDDEYTSDAEGDNKYNLIYGTSKLKAYATYSFVISKDGTKMDIEMRIVVINTGKVNHSKSEISMFVEVLPHGWMGQNPDWGYMQVMVEQDQVGDYRPRSSYAMKRLTFSREAGGENAPAPALGRTDYDAGITETAISGEGGNSESVVKVDSLVDISPNSEISVMGFSKSSKCEIREIFDPQKDPTNFSTEIVWENDGVLPGGVATIFRMGVYKSPIFELGKVTLLANSEKKVTNILSKAIGITAKLIGTGTNQVVGSKNLIYPYALTIYNSEIGTPRVLTIRNRFAGTNWKMATENEALKFAREELPENEQYKTSSSIGVATLTIDGKHAVYQYEFSVIVYS